MGSCEAAQHSGLSSSDLGQHPAFSAHQRKAWRPAAVSFSPRWPPLVDDPQATSIWLFKNVLLHLHLIVVYWKPENTPPPHATMCMKSQCIKKTTEKNSLYQA